MRASHCSGFSCCRAQAVGARASVLQMWCTSFVALWHVESSRPETEPMSPALAGGFLATVAPGEFHLSFVIGVFILLTLDVFIDVVEFECTVTPFLFFGFLCFFFFFPLFFFSSFLMEEMTVKFFLFLFLTHTLYFFFLSVGYIHLAFHSPVMFNVALLHIKYRNLATVYIHIPIVFYVLVINLPGLYKLKTS